MIYPNKEYNIQNKDPKMIKPLKFLQYSQNHTITI